MTRKDYRVIAKALGIAGKTMADAGWEQTLDIMCRSLEKNYSSFDRVTFEAAANMTRTMPWEALAKASS